jgi:hypothetical protein
MAARWASHDFGKEVLFWSKDGKRIYPEMGYAAGELQYEQVVLVQELVHLLTVNGPDDFEDCVAQNQNFSFYKGLYEFVNSKGGRLPPDVQRSMLGYYKLYRSLPLTEEDKKYLDTRVTQAFLEYKEGRLPRKGEARYQVLGLVYFLKINSLAIEKQAGWYEKVRRDWEFFKSLRQELRQDFDKMGILSSENRQNVLEDWINARLEFKTATLPRQAKNLGDLSFSDFFRPAEENPAFTARERALMQEVIKKAAGEKKGLNLSAVEALNNYNFGVWLNEILGDLYRSHGCLHVSPLNIYFLYELLPVNTPVTVYDYSKKITAAQHAAIPSLANLVNFAQDLEKLKEKFMGTAEARVAVYPSAGLWIIFLDNQPFAKLQVKGGPQTPMYTVQGRDDKGSPVFEDHLAYPTTTGSFRVLNKVQDYVSNIYYDTTVIPMGGEIIKTEKRWKFKDANGKWQVVPKVIQEDLDAPAAQRQYTYYDEVVSVSGEVVALRWGSHPFGKYAIQNTKDGYNLFPELIHSSGDLMMEERQLINDLIKILSAPYDDLDKCIKASPNFELYKACFDFMRDPSREDLIQPRERLSYRLYQGLPISSSEASLLPKDVIAADKVLRKQPLNNEEINVLLSEGVAYRRGTKINLYNE